MVAARLTLDPAGNMTGVPKPADLANGLPCTYDAWNRLVEVAVHAVVTFRYEYDGLNRRTVTVRHITGYPSNYNHRYYNASWQVVETRVYDSGGQPETAPPRYQYVWSARYIDSPVLRDGNGDQDGLCDDARYYFLGDANFNVTCLVDTGGDAVERYLYDPYGVATIYTGDWSHTRNSSSYHNVYLYTGRERDVETRYYNYRNRYYHAQLGRFLSRDPIGYRAGDPNLYRYVGNRPTNGIDPSGKASELTILSTEISWTSWWCWGMLLGGYDLSVPFYPGVSSEKDLGNIVAQQSGCLKTLNLAGHGWAGSGIYFGGGTGFSSNSDCEVLERISKKLCGDATVNLYSCGNDAAGIQNLANLLEATVCGCTGTCYWNYYVFYCTGPHCSGDWICKGPDESESGEEKPCKCKKKK